MLKKLSATLLIASMLGLGGGAVISHLAGADRAVAETSETAETARSGAFQGFGRYKSGGSATVSETAAGETVVAFDDFSVSRGPDLKVWLVKNGDIRTARDVLKSEYVSLGVLTSNTGAQSYVLPEGVDIADYDSVVIWCERFSVLFAAATLS